MAIAMNTSNRNDQHRVLAKGNNYTARYRWWLCETRKTTSDKRQILSAQQKSSHVTWRLKENFHTFILMATKKAGDFTSTLYQTTASSHVRRKPKQSTKLRLGNLRFLKEGEPSLEGLYGQRTDCFKEDTRDGVFMKTVLYLGTEYVLCV